MKVVVDTREQTPWTFASFPDVQVQSGTLNSGDYTLSGLGDLIAIERKELGDFIGCVTSGRDRFKNELLRLRSFRVKAVIVEADFASIMAGDYRSKVNPESVIGSISSWMCRYNVPFIFAGGRSGAERMCHSMLKNFLQQMEAFQDAIASHTA